MKNEDVFASPDDFAAQPDLNEKKRGTFAGGEPEVLHIYIVDETGELQPDERVVESTITPTSEYDAEAHATSPLKDEILAEPSELFYPVRRLLWLGIGLCIVLAAINGVLYLPPLFGASSVNVTLIPVERPITMTMTVFLSTSGVTHPAAGALVGRTLSTLTLTQATTVPTSGTGHELAEPGRGRITFYNAAPYAQLLPAGTLLTGHDGTEVITDEETTIPAAAYPAFGQVTVMAHTALTGPTGNISADDIYGPCCQLNVSAVNSAFTGGQNARTFPMVTSQDIATAETLLRPHLLASVQAALKAQLEANETQVLPVPCREAVESSSGINEEATSVTVQMSEMCTGLACDTGTLTALVTEQLARQARNELGMGYALTGMVTFNILNASPRPRAGMITVTIKGIGAWAYQFSEGELLQMPAAIAGKNETQATTLLLHDPGVSQVEMSGVGSTLPSDSTHIHMLVVE